MTGDVDIAIVGGGIAGTALAVALADLPLRIVLLEAASAEPAPQPQTGVSGFDTRVSALTEHSRQFFARLGVWASMTQQRVSAYRRMTVWDAEGTGEIQFDCREVAAASLGHIVENRVIVSALRDKLLQQSTVALRQPARVKALDRCGEQNVITLQDGTQLMPRLLVAADGGNSFVRQSAGFRTREWDYQHKAIVCTVQTEQSHRQTAWQRFLRQGPLAFLPLHEAGIADAQQCFSSIVWSAVPEFADQLMALDDAGFALQLERAFESRLGRICQVSARQCFPLQQRHALDYVQPGLALIADAAHTIHPLAGQGINLGLKDVEVLAEEIRRAHARALPVGSLDVLQRYQRRRKADNLATMAAMEGFKQLFARRELPLRWLRNTGMHAINAAPLLKRQLIAQAMGI